MRSQHFRDIEEAVEHEHQAHEAKKAQNVERNLTVGVGGTAEPEKQ